MRKLVLAGVLFAASLTPSVVAAQVSVNVNIGPPPVIFASPPRVVIVPKTPVYYAPDTSYDVFVYQDRYYAFHDGGWFLATTHRGPWLAIGLPHVPQPLLAVPTQYYKVPPGHAKHGHWKASGDHPGRGRGDGHPGRGRGKNKHKD